MTNITHLTRRATLKGIAGLSASSAMPNLGIAEESSFERPAPKWDISEWINQDLGNIDRLRGKVVVIDFFQLWCPGCNKFSGPLMSKWQTKFSKEIDAGQLQLLKIHTVFEGHSHQTVKRLKRYIKEKNITLPVGVDRHEAGSRIPVTMERYRTSGTPEMVIIDKNGMIMFQQFGYFDPTDVEPGIIDMMATDA